VPKKFEFQFLEKKLQKLKEVRIDFLEWDGGGHGLHLEIFLQSAKFTIFFQKCQKECNQNFFSLNFPIDYYI